MLSKMREDFIRLYKCEPTRAFFSPGRINLIGEYTDVQGGFVLPAALDIGTYALVSKRDDDCFNLYSNNLNDGIHEIKISEASHEGKRIWTDYLMGMILVYMESIKIDHGLNILIEGNIPNSSGLSSSASIEVLMGHILTDVYGNSFDKVKNVLLAQKCENEVVGVKCGVMDQFAVEMGKKDCAIFLKTDNLEYKYINFPFTDIDIVIMNTNKKRGLKDSKYNERRSELERGLKELKTKLAIDNLCQLDNNQFDEYAYLIKNVTDYKRCKHVVYENNRVKKAVDCLHNKDLLGLAKLINDSHDSLRDDFEVTGVELDTLVDSARFHKAIAARMTGAGFGGCAIFLSKKSDTQRLIKQITKDYVNKLNFSPSFYAVNLCDGARRLY